MESRYNNEPPELVTIIKVNPSVPNKDSIKLTSADELNSFMVELLLALKISFIKSGTNTITAITYSVESTMVKTLYPKKGKVNAMPRPLISTKLNIH